MSRPRDFVEFDAIEGAMHAFWLHGYAGTNLPNLLDAMGLTRGSFYQAFGDKHAVYLRALSHYGETRVLPATAALRDADTGPAKQRILSFFDLTVPPVVEAPDERVGCFLCNAMVEMAPFDRDCEALCASLTADIETSMAQALRELQPTASDAEVRRKAAGLQRLYFGAHAMRRMGAPMRDWSDLIDEIL